MNRLVWTNHFLIRKYAFQPSVFGTASEVRRVAQTNAANAMPKITWGRGRKGAGKATFLSLVDSKLKPYLVIKHKKLKNQT